MNGRWKRNLVADTWNWCCSAPKARVSLLLAGLRSFAVLDRCGLSLIDRLFVSADGSVLDVHRHSARFSG